MAPFIYFKSSKKTNITTTTPKNDYPATVKVTWKFRTHRLVTVMAIFLWIFYIAVSPFMVKIASDLYSNTRRHQDNFFIIVAKFTMANDVLCSLIIMASHIWQREKIVQILNLFNEILMRIEQLESNFVGFKITMALIFKFGLTIYEMLLSLPFLVAASSRLSTQSIVAFLFTLYLQELSYIFALNIFTFILLVLSCSLQLEKELECSLNIGNDFKMSQLIRLQDSLQKLIGLFLSTFQFGIFLIILLYFVTILSNIYAMLDYYVTNHQLFRTFITYIFSVAVELYCLIFVSYLCERSQRKVKDLFLQREELYFLKLSEESLSIVETDLLWPHLHEFQLLGLYKLNNEFGLFLLAYSINFIMIILEFEVNKAALK
ncbi:putative gustatory receptor 89a [Calliphora vicina]|uniref:putative gustatory receptor 89a n=1 Tax=Calliphora vicina TaxID=7373 RepID=UPI00325A7476